MTILLVNEVSYKSTLFILLCKTLACFWLMGLVPSTSLWISPAILFKSYLQKRRTAGFGLFSPEFLPFVWEILLIVVHFCLSVCLSFSLLSVCLFLPFFLLSFLCWVSDLGFLAYQANVPPLSCIPSPSACFSAFELLGGASLASGRAPLCLPAAGQMELPCAETIPFLRMLALPVTGLLVQGLEPAETPASRAFWSSTNCILEPYNRCLPHGSPQLWMAKREAGCMPRP